MEILDRMSRALPATANEQHELADLRAQIRDSMDHANGQIEEIDHRLRAITTQNPDLLVAAAEELMSEIFALIDPVIDQLREAKTKGDLSDQDKKKGKEYLAMLEDCSTILAGMKGNPPAVPSN